MCTFFFFSETLPLREKRVVEAESREAGGLAIGETIMYLYDDTIAWLTKSRKKVYACLHQEKRFFFFYFTLFACLVQHVGVQNEAVAGALT